MRHLTMNRVNKFHNLHEWALDNPYPICCCSFQQRYSVNIQARLTDDYLTGPYMIANCIGGIQYADFLERTDPLLSEDGPHFSHRQLLMLGTPVTAVKHAYKLEKVTF